MSIEDEVGIPPEAFLLPSNENSTNDSIKTPSLRTTQGAIIPLTMETSVRKNNNEIRCLLVGRQASVSDIRIQHGSISRRHGAFYFMKQQSSSNMSLILQDLQGKHGIYVNGERLPVGSQRALNNDDYIIFGNVRESRFYVQLASSSTTSSSSTDTPATAVRQHEQQQVEQTDKTVTTTAEIPPNNDHSSTIMSDRAKREAEIKAMMDSFDEKPTYKKYVASASEQEQTPSTNEDNDDHGNDAITKQKIGVIEEYKLPISEIFPISSPTPAIAASDDTARYSIKNTVTCIAPDPSGSRFVVGGNADYYIRMYDFSGMDRLRTHPFQTLIVEDGHLIVDAAYSNSGDRVIVATGSAQPKIFDRDGAEIIQFVRGDMYVNDPARTTGHTASVTSVYWHPFERDIILTSSIDGSVRIWDLNGKKQFQMLVCNKVFTPKNKRGQKTRVTCAVFHPNGREIAVGTICGSIQIFNINKPNGTTRPERVVYVKENMQQSSLIIHSIVYNFDGSKIASRCNNELNDNCMVQVWDAKRISSSSKPQKNCDNVPSVYERSNSSFSPDGKILCVGTSEYNEQGQSDNHSNSNRRTITGGIKFFLLSSDSSSDAILDIEISKTAGVIIVIWHPKLNQIFLGCSDGRILILFDPNLSASKKGALLPFKKSGRQLDGLSQLLKSRAPTGSAALLGKGTQNIVAPFALPGGNRKRSSNSANGNAVLSKKQQRQDPILSRKPEPPATGIKFGGQGSAGVNFTQFVVDSMAAQKDGSGKTKMIAGSKDPREELFKYNEGKSYIESAYDVNSNPTILAEKTVEQEEEEIRKGATGGGRK